MVNVPSSDRVHVISAWIVPKEKTLNKINSMCFFIMEINEIGRRPSEILVLSLEDGQATFTTDKYDGKAHALNGHGTFRLLVLVVLKIGRLQGEENKSKSSMLYLCRESVVAHPS